MITEDKVTEMFCIADDFCKVFDAQMAKYTFKTDKKRQYHRDSRMRFSAFSAILNGYAPFFKPFFSRF